MFFVRPGYVNSLSSVFADNDVEAYVFAIAHAPLHLVRVFPSDRCAVDEGVLVGVVAIDETLFALDVKPFVGTAHSLICVTAQVTKGVPCLQKLSVGLSVLIRGVVTR